MSAVANTLKPTKNNRRFSTPLSMESRSSSRLAGTGKISLPNDHGNVLKGYGQYTAFNKSLVTDSASKFSGSRVACNTTHSLAFKAEGFRFASRLSSKRMRSDEIAWMLGLKIKLIGNWPKRLPAGQVLMAVNRFCQSDRTYQIEDWHFPYIEGIDMPIAEKHCNNNASCGIRPAVRRQRHGRI